MTQTHLTRELIELLFPEHCRTSCNDVNLNNSFPHYDNGTARCHRCLALSHIDEPLSDFKLYTTIAIPPDAEEIRQRALAKLTPQEKAALGF